MITYYPTYIIHTLFSFYLSHMMIHISDIKIRFSFFLLILILFLYTFISIYIIINIFTQYYIIINLFILVKLSIFDYFWSILNFSQNSSMISFSDYNKLLILLIYFNLKESLIDFQHPIFLKNYFNFVSIVFSENM